MTENDSQASLSEKMENLNNPDSELEAKAETTAEAPVEAESEPKPDDPAPNTLDLQSDSDHEEIKEKSEPRDRVQSGATDISELTVDKSKDLDETNSKSSDHGKRSSDEDSLSSSDSGSDKSGRGRKKKSKKSLSRQDSKESFNSRSRSASRSRSRSPRRRRRRGSSSDSYSSDNSSSKEDIGPKEERPMVLRITNLSSRPSLNALKEGLFHEFKGFGKLQSLQVKLNDHNEKIGLIIYYKNSDARKALFEGNNKRMMGSEISVQLADDIDPATVAQAGSIVDEMNPRASRTLFIGNLDAETTERDLRRTFKDLGQIIAIEIKNIPMKPPPFAFIQFDSIMGVVRAIKAMDGEMLGQNRIKCGWGKTMPYEVLWLDALPEFANPKVVYQELAKFEPMKILVDNNRGRALVYFPSDDHVKNVLFECKVKTLPVLKQRIRMDYASPALIENFKNQMVRDKCSTSPYICPQPEVSRFPNREAPKSSGVPLLATTPHTIPLAPDGTALAPPVEASHRERSRDRGRSPSRERERSHRHRESLREPREDSMEIDEEAERQELEKKIKNRKKENISLLNQITNEKASNGQIDPVNIAICDGNNVLRSMEIHRVLQEKNEFCVKSYGVEKKVRIAADENTEIEFDYKMSFLDIAKELANLPEHGEIFRKNGIIELLAKNRELKQGPENFISATQRFDIIFTVELAMIEKVIGLLDKLVARGQVPDPIMRNNGFGSTCHIINIDIGDFKADAALGAQLIGKICSMISDLPEPDRQLPKLIKRFKKKFGTDIKHVAVQLF